MFLKELKEVWNAGLVNIYARVYDDFANIYKNDYLDGLSDEYDGYTVQGIYHSCENDIFEIWISK